MIAQRRTTLDVRSTREALDICYLGDDAAVIVEDNEWIEEEND
jgi:hypothetical protein